MLVHGALLRCAGPVLTIAAAMGHGRPVFYSPPDKCGEAQVLFHYHIFAAWNTASSAPAVFGHGCQATSDSDQSIILKAAKEALLATISPANGLMTHSVRL